MKTKYYMRRKDLIYKLDKNGLYLYSGAWLRCGAWSKSRYTLEVFASLDKEEISEERAIALITYTRFTK